MRIGPINPLVTIIVITYNSTRFVLETLESAKNQSYQNIELIVTDDNSSDDTIYICTKWIEENKLRFVRTEIIKAETNTGIPANINRGLKRASGTWIKCIAGDDLLARDCLSELINYIFTQQEDIRILFSDIVKFSGDSVENGQLKKNPNKWFCSRDSSARDQYEMLLRYNRVFASSVIIRGDLLKSLNGFDERYKLLEDWPMWLRITNMGYKIFHLDKALIFYRIHDQNLSQTTNQNYLCHPVNRIDIKFNEIEVLPRLPFIERLGLKHRIIGIKFCFLLGNDGKNPFKRLIYNVYKKSNPFNLYLHLLKMLGITYRNHRYL